MQKRLPARQHAVDPQRAGNDLLDALVFGTFAFGSVLETARIPGLYQNIKLEKLQILEDKDLTLI